MPKTTKFLRKQIGVLVHVLAWVIVAYVFCQAFRIEFKKLLLVNGQETQRIEIHTFTGFIIITLVCKALFFYLNALYRPVFVQKGKKMVRYAAFCCILMLGLVTIELLAVVIANSVWNINTPPFTLFIWAEVLMWVFTFVISFTWFKMREWDKAERLSEKIAGEHLKSELGFLKAQISPHFFLNTLNNLYSMAQARDIDELEDGILQLSEMMRYMLYDCQSDTVPIEREVECIRSYVGLSLLRYRQDGNINVTFNAAGADLIQHMIAPVILVPFVENAFKHGISPVKPSVINIDLMAENGNLIFKVKNTDHAAPLQRFESGGIGINNVKRRLEMLYPDSHQLEIKKDHGYYHVWLKLTEK